MCNLKIWNENHSKGLQILVKRSFTSTKPSCKTHYSLQILLSELLWPINVWNICSGIGMSWSLWQACVYLWSEPNNCWRLGLESSREVNCQVASGKLIELRNLDHTVKPRMQVTPLLPVMAASPCYPSRTRALWWPKSCSTPVEHIVETS
jgi:hypothetical protein